MKFGRQLHEETDTVQLAPLIDIVFLTLIVFMLTSVYASVESEVDITLPTADSAVQTDRAQGEIFINLGRDGKIVLNQRELTIAELQEQLYLVAKHFPGSGVIIRGDREAMLGNAIAVLDCCRKADIQNVAFAALPEETRSSQEKSAPQPAG